MNLALFIPEITMAVFAILVILLDSFIGQKRLSWVALGGVLVTAVLTIGIGGSKAVSYNSMFVFDQFALFFKLLFLAIAFLVILASSDYAGKLGNFRGEYYALILLSTTGMMLMAATTELISIYVSLELTSISLYALVGFLKNPRSSESSLKYLLIGAISSAFLLYGMALVFGYTGVTQLSGIATALRNLSATTLAGSPALMLGVILIMGGFAFKIASVPFQMWVPDVYEGAPTTVTAFLSVASKASGFAVIMRVFFTAFNAPEWLSLNWAIIFAILAALSMTLGNIVAIPQANIKRLLGYSSIAQAGYIMVGLAAMGLSPANDVSGRSGIIFFLISYALTNLGAFIAIIAITNKIGSDDIKDFTGMFKRAPVLALALTLCLVSLIGMPPAAGFMGKFFIFTQAVQHNLLWLVIIAVINSVISAYYYLRVVKVMWFGEPASAEAVPSSFPLRLALAICCAGVFALGLFPSQIMRYAQAAAQIFTGS